METTLAGAVADPLSAGAAVLVHAPQQEVRALEEAYAEGEIGPIETLRRLHALLRNIDAVVKPLQEARDAVREAMQRPLLAAGGVVELGDEGNVTWVEPIITESYGRKEVDRFVSDLAAQGGPMAAVAAQLAALKKVGTRAGFVKVEKGNTPPPQAADEPPF